MRQVVAIFGVVTTMVLAGAASAQAKYVDTTKVNCRQAASVRSPVIAQFVRNTPVTVLYSGRGWSQIDHEPLCWIRSWLLAREPGARVETQAPGLQARPVGDTLRRPVWLRSGR